MAPCLRGRHVLMLRCTFQPMAREYQNGDGFVYVLAFRKKDTQPWTVVRVPHVESSRYVYYNDSLAPYSPFEVKIKAYNRRGEGPFSQIALVYSAEEGEFSRRVLAASPPGHVGLRSSL